MLEPVLWHCRPYQCTSGPMRIISPLDCAVQGTLWKLSREWCRATRARSRIKGRYEVGVRAFGHNGCIEFRVSQLKGASCSCQRSTDIGRAPSPKMQDVPGMIGNRAHPAQSKGVKRIRESHQGHQREVRGFLARWHLADAAYTCVCFVYGPVIRPTAKRRAGVAGCRVYSSCTNRAAEQALFDQFAGIFLLLRT